MITDSRGNTDSSVAAKELFFTIKQANFGEVLRGVSFAPSSGDSDDDHGDDN